MNLTCQDTCERQLSQILQCFKIPINISSYDLKKKTNFPFQALLFRLLFAFSRLLNKDPWVCSHRAISTNIQILCYKDIGKCSLICTYDVCKQSCGQWSIPLCINGGHNACEKTLLSAKGGALQTYFPLSEFLKKSQFSFFS